MEQKLNVRYVARFTVEAATPLRVGSGNSSHLVDQLIQTDANGLPMIQGSSLAGVLRASLLSSREEPTVAAAFEELLGSPKTGGSRLVVSNAHLVGAAGAVVEGLDYSIDPTNPYYAALAHLPVRDHVRITHRGGADTENHGKFDEEVLLKGCRFVFQLELKGSEADGERWQQILAAIASPNFRIGGGTRKGFGELKLVACRQVRYDLREATQLQHYCDLTGSFNQKIGESIVPQSSSSVDATHYKLELTPDDFFLFSSGDADELVDMSPKRERIVEWSAAGLPSISEEYLLIPATSVKGAIAHRTAFHYNRLQEIFAGEVSVDEHVGECNVAVRELFGSSSNLKKGDGGLRGRVISSDLYKKATREVILQHVAIDRFTGGAIDGALFNERVCATDSWELSLYLNQADFSPNVVEAFEAALRDITTGYLPLGGGVMRGHGAMCGKLYRNNEKI